MASDTDDLEQQLRRNLKLRRELGAEVAKSTKVMASDTGDLEQLRQELKQRAARRARWDMRAILHKVWTALGGIFLIGIIPGVYFWAVYEGAEPSRIWMPSRDIADMRAITLEAPLMTQSGLVDWLGILACSRDAGMGV